MRFSELECSCGPLSRLALPASQRAFACVLSGEISLAGQTVRADETAWSDPCGPPLAGSTLPLTVSERGEPSKVMIYSGRPIGEPVALGGPFVMNKPAEIAQAFADFQAGTFGAGPVVTSGPADSSVRSRPDSRRRSP